MLIAIKRINLLIQGSKYSSTKVGHDFIAGESLIHRKVGLTSNEQIKLRNLISEEISDAHSLTVSVIGLPNSGKSTLINSLNRWRITASSKKVHTTRKNILSTLTEGNTQIVLYDTPGLVSAFHCKKHGLDKNMVTCPHEATSQADLIAVVIDSFNPWTRHHLDPITLSHLHKNRDKPSILILNKVDLLKSKPILLEIMRTLTDARCMDEPIPYFTESASPNHKKSSSKNNLIKLKDSNLCSEQDSTAENKSSEDILTNWKILEQIRIRHRLNSKKREQGPTDDIISSVGENVKLPHNIDNSLVYTNYKPLHLTDPATPDSTFKGKVDEVSGINIDPNTPDVKKMGAWPYFQEIFMVSSTTNDGIEEIRDYFTSKALPRPWTYNSSFVTDQIPEDIVIDAIRAVLMDEFQHQIPYILGIKIEEYYVDEYGLFRVKAAILCPQQNLIKIIIGPKGERIKQISQNVSQNLMNTFRSDLYLSLVVKYDKGQK